MEELMFEMDFEEWKKHLISREWRKVVPVEA